MTESAHRLSSAIVLNAYEIGKEILILNQLSLSLKILQSLDVH
jgi:hypothetical protein